MVFAVSYGRVGVSYHLSAGGCGQTMNCMAFGIASGSISNGYSVCMCAKGGVKPRDIMRAKAMDLLAERLTTALEIESNLTRTLEAAYLIGEKPVTRERTSYARSSERWGCQYLAWVRRMKCLRNTKRTIRKRRSARTLVATKVGPNR
jgi:hypothetical protein